MEKFLRKFSLFFLVSGNHENRKELSQIRLEKFIKSEDKSYSPQMIREQISNYIQVDKYFKEHCHHYKTTNQSIG
jgi:hypothetical protein